MPTYSTSPTVIKISGAISASQVITAGTNDRRNLTAFSTAANESAEFEITSVAASGTPTFQVGTASVANITTLTNLIYQGASNATGVSTGVLKVGPSTTVYWGGVSGTDQTLTVTGVKYINN